MKWTEDQQKAIEARKGTLLVSAAAGSGKTAVLVERVIQRLCDSEDPCGVEQLLIVTFTNAAAAQMKEKISAAIGARIALDPSNKRLRRQQLMLPCASICTIDSFCIGLVRENFHALGISPDFELLDEGKRTILRNQAAETVVEAKYENASPDFLRLCALISSARDDQPLVDAVLKLYELSQAYPFPERWLNSLCDEFEAERPIEETPWGRLLTGEAARFLRSACGNIDRCLGMLAEEPELEAKYAPTFLNDRAMLSSLLEAAEGGEWDELCRRYAAAAFGKMGTAPRGCVSYIKEACGVIRKKYKADFEKLGEFLTISAGEHAADVAALAPVVRELIGTVNDFAAEFARLKLEENSADFSDTLHFALKLLVRETTDGYKRTPLAAALSENYAEILVDEYQDVNEAQDMIFSALSRDESNLFMVGDVKQSIYCFRQAMPEIFLARRDRYAEYEGGNYPARVTLGKNFRSRSGVTDIVNYIFSAVMSREAGGLEYDKGEHLEAAASYPEREGADAELCLIESEDNPLHDQAVFAANYIEHAVAGGLQVTEGGALRTARYKDFCLLFASTKNSAGEFIAELNRRGIPVNCESGGGFLTSPEISFMISLLKVIDNPVDDIPLTAVLLSPVFGFLPDDLALMRAAHRDGSIYHCLVNAAESGDARAAAFLERLGGFRRIACTVKAGELVRRLVEETGYAAIVCAMKEPDTRRANLNRFIDLANKFESMGSVAGLIRYIDKIIKSGGDIAGSDSSGAADAVSIMTIHKSKGLEFPVCILGDCQKAYSDRSLRDDLIIAPESGIGIKNNKGRVKFDTLPRLAAKLETKRAERSEALRVLYVALTRAKEKLIMLSSAKDWGKSLAAIAAKSGCSERIDPYTVGGFTSYSEAIISALLRHPDANALRMAAGVPSGFTVPCDTPLKASIIKAGEAEEAAKEAPSVAPDPVLLAEIERRLGYEYPFAQLEGVVAKRIASKLDPTEADSEYFASRRPSFAGRGRLTPAQRGTATHRFMQYADYSRACKSVADELTRLTEDGMLTAEEANAVDARAVARFFDSGLYARMSRAERIYKEYSFTCSVPVSELYPQLPCGLADGEVVLIEGVADCAFVEGGELVVVDYKTDKASSAAELAERYGAQLGIYRRCLAEVLGMPVKETVIYSFRLNESITL